MTKYKHQRLAVLHEKNILIHNFLYTLKEISFEYDPIDATNGFIKAWIEIGAEINAEIERMERNNK